MGEKSKTIGELGENIYGEMLSIFGWSHAENISIYCNKRSSHNKISHGIDSLVIQKNPLIAEETEIGIVSVKNIQSGKYSSNFKNYANDVIETSTCFMRSTRSAEYLESVNTKRKTEKQLLFWITNDKGDNHSTIKEISNVYTTTKEDYKYLIVADNRTIAFHYNLREFIKIKFIDALSVDYFYPDTGLNETINELRLLQGKKLPIDWISSPIISYKVSLRDDKNVLVLGLNEAFEEDSFRRLMGLSQNLTGGWCNKIILCFPDYRYQEHKKIKDKVLLQIADEDFSGLIDIASFNPSFQSLEELNKGYFKSVENKPEEPQDFNIERMLPYGDMLRQLLTQPYINKSDIVKILMRRGVFPNKSLQKIDLIPILSTSFISPSELEYLRKCQLSRANSERISSSNIVTSDDEEAVQESVMKCDIPFEKIVKEISPNADLSSVTKFTIHEDGSIRLKLKTKSHNISKGWAKSNTNNTTEIIINKAQSHGKNAKARIDIVASSDENKKIGQKIVQHIEDSIKSDGNLRRDFTLEKTLANEFSHNNRADLLFTFFKKEINNKHNIRFKDLKNVDFVMNPSQTELKDDLLTLKDKVERSIFSGRNLQEIKYINDSKYYEYLIFTVIIADFSFSYKKIKGVFEVQYGFPGYDPLDNVDKSEFEFKITRVTPFIERNLTNKENHDIEAYLKEEFGRLKQEVINVTSKKYGIQTKLFE